LTAALLQYIHIIWGIKRLEVVTMAGEPNPQIAEKVKELADLVSSELTQQISVAARLNVFKCGDYECTGSNFTCSHFRCTTSAFKVAVVAE
jgi:hypothetical protein